MLDYIWLDDESPILQQVPKGFQSAAILLHPFVQMPLGWEKSMRKRQYQHIYPNDEEALNIGKSVPWREIMSQSSLNSYNELAIALITSIGAFKKEYKRTDLANKLNSNLNSDLFYPTEDSTSVFLLDNLLKVVGSKGASKLYFSDPLSDNSGVLNIEDTNSLDICNLFGPELIVTDENMDYAFMSLYDSFTTLLFAKDKNIEHIVQLLDCEAIICEQETAINWYF
ncbi:hypothetical protein BAMA_16800 [Bacillus manliponensis]|uniref:DUF2711 domain-containing protein n=1 Tax=Bacillus manliponensis TaxID=574376 RepID=A0A073K0M8_9BACI|nr:DUF2711 family protein [Bacillus manliponensis]KEK20111.1 hypothetical protein BAMA_16800 [Bacillus manliponensis]